MIMYTFRFKNMRGILPLALSCFISPVNTSREISDELFPLNTGVIQLPTENHRFIGVPHRSECSRMTTFVGWESPAFNQGREEGTF